MRRAGRSAVRLLDPSPIAAPAGCGAGPSSVTASPPGRRPGAGGPDGSLTIRWSVTHAASRCDVWSCRVFIDESGPLRITQATVSKQSATWHTRGEWHSPRTVDPSDSESRGRPTRVGAARQGIVTHDGTAAASRDAAAAARTGGREPAATDRPPSTERGPDRRGQAPKGTGGMPRRHQDSGVEGCEKSGGAAQRASIPECPRRPGELKHLSTRRKRNQPRLPQ